MKKLIFKVWNSYLAKEKTAYFFTGFIAKHFGILQVLQNKRLRPIYTKLLYLGLKNTQIISKQCAAIWPFWVNEQFGVKSKFFAERGFQLLTLNTTHRNWTTLSLPQFNEKVIVDPKGLITPHNLGWSIDFWLLIENKLVSPADLAQVSQRLIDNFPILQTSFNQNDINVTIETFFKPSPAGEPILFIQATLKNTLDKAQAFSFIPTIRPYNPEGFSPIEKVNYLSSNAFVINHSLGLILDQAPDNVLCVSKKDGDVAEFINQWDMILETHCRQKQASACAEYKLELAPGAQKIFTFKIPLRQEDKLLSMFQDKLSLVQINSLKEKIHLLQTMHYQEEKEQLEQTWQEIDQKLISLTISDKTLEATFFKNLYHLMNFIGTDYPFAGSFTYKDFWFRDAVFCTMALNRIGAVDYSQKIVQNMFKHNLPHLYPYLNDELDWLGQSLIIIYDTFQYSQNQNLLIESFDFIDKQISRIEHNLTKGLLARSASFDTAQKDYFLYDDYWALAGVKAAVKVATLLNKPKKIEKYIALKNKLETGLSAFIQNLFEHSTYQPHLPFLATPKLDSRLINSLVAVYPLNLFAADDPLVNTTIAYIEKLFCEEGIFFNSVGHVGYPPALNCLLAQVYLARNDSAKTISILNWLTKKASSTGCWPEAIHPTTGGGIVGDGHYALASAQYLTLVRNLLVKEAENIINITPLILPEWLNADMNLTAKNIPTKFGIVNFACTCIGKKIVYQFANEFHTKPTELIIHLPMSIKRVTYDQIQRDVFNVYVMVPADVTKVELELA